MTTRGLGLHWQPFTEGTQMSDFFVVGVTGQDGALLARELLARGHTVTGTHRRFSPTSFWRLEQMGIDDRIHFLEYEIGSPLNLQSSLLERKPRAVFFTAGDSSTASAASSPSWLMATNAAGAAEQIEVLRTVAPDTPAVFFSSSEVFGYQTRPGVRKNENSRRRPSNPYGISKIALGELLDFYRREEGMKFFEAVLFPHESPFRASSFLVKKVVRTLCKWSLSPHGSEVANFGSLDSSRDWGSAAQYMKWLVELAERGNPGSYVIGTGRHHSVWDVFLATGRALGIDLQKVKSNSVVQIVEQGSGSVIANAESRSLGNSGHGPVASTAKLRDELSIEAAIPFEDMVWEMVGFELALLRGDEVSEIRRSDG